jgi:hypothetical protein
MLAARPAPTPLVLVGVLTLTKIISASAIAALISVEKNKFLMKSICVNIKRLLTKEENHFEIINGGGMRISNEHLLSANRLNKFIKSRFVDR